MSRRPAWWGGIRRWLCALPLFACNRFEPTYTDAWTSTAALCGWTDHVATAEDYSVPPGAAQYPSEACVDQVLADLHADVPAFLAADGLADPYAEVLGRNATTVRSRLGSLLSGARALFVFRYGTVGDLKENPFISAAFVETMTEVATESGTTDMRAVFYNYVTTVVSSTRPGDSTQNSLSLSPDDRILHVHDPNMRATDPASGMVHESHHAWGHPHDLVSYGGEKRYVDHDVSGAFGYGASVLVLSWKYNQLDWLREMTEIGLEKAVFSHLTPFLDDEGNVLAEYHADRIDLSRY